MDSLQKTEEMSAAVAKNPDGRVKLADIEANIAAEYYTSGSRLVGDDIPTSVDLSIMTICTLVTNNGFIVLGKSAPADSQNFNADLGRKFAREDAIRQLWPLMAYALKERIYHGY